MGIGKILQKARSKKGISVSQAHAATKINSEYIEALESERFELIPSPTYVRGFLKMYGEFLGVDYKSLISEYTIRYGGAAKKIKKSGEKVERLKTLNSGRSSLKLSSPGIFVIICLVVLICAFFIKLVFFSGRSEDQYYKDVTSPMPAQYLDIKTASVKLPVIVSRGDAQHEVEVTASEDVWIAVWLDGKEFPAGILSAGQGEKWLGGKIHLKIGNAGGLKVKVDGKPLKPLGKPGEVVHLYIDDTGVKTKKTK